MDIASLSSRYAVKKLTFDDVPDMLRICEGNPLYFLHCPPKATVEMLQGDLTVLPKGMTPDDKHYVGFFDGGKLIALMDLVTGYPDRATAFIGFFMMAAEMQSKGLSTGIIDECGEYLRTEGFTSLMLGYAKGNPQSEAFWLKNGFVKTGRETPADGYTVVVMKKRLT